MSANKIISYTNEKVYWEKETPIENNSVAVTTATWHEVSKMTLKIVSCKRVHDISRGLCVRTVYEVI